MLDTATTIVPTAWARSDRARDINPHRQLMAAVLQTAIDDCWDSFRPRSAGYGTLAAGRRFREARVYMLSKDRVWPFSFENLCDELDLDVRKLRRALLGAPGATTVRHQPRHDRTDARVVGGVASFLGLKFTETEYEWNKANAG